jgi:hypothetical protein
MFQPTRFMKKRSIGALLFAILSTCCWGQAIPYELLKELEDCTTTLRRTPGVTAEVQLLHNNPKDSRNFQLTLETPSERANIPVGVDGRFRLTQVSPEVQSKTRVLHSLEKGALALSILFQIDRNWPGTHRANKTIYADCSEIGGSISELKPALVRLGKVIPEFANFRVSIVGVSLMREKPSAGFALLKNGDKTVSSFNLSETGKASWMFSDYDPKIHTIAFEMKNNGPEPQMFMEFDYGPGSVPQKGAIMALDTTR